MNPCNYNVGFLGAGYILKAHVRAVKAVAQARLHTVCDVSLGRARAAADEHGIANACASIEELLNSGCDVIHVLLPPHLHMQAAAQCLRAGKHVLLEKPMAPNGGECRELDALAQSVGRQLGVNHNFLFTPAYERLRHDVKARALGRLDHLQVNWLHPLGQLQFGPFDNWMLAEPGNLFLEVGPHLAAFVIDLLGSVEDVQVVLGEPISLPGGLLAYGHWHVVARSGSTAVNLSVSFASGQSDRSLRLRGLAKLGQVDFGRDLYWSTGTHSVSTMFDNLGAAVSTSKGLLGQAGANFGVALRGALQKSSAQDPFGNSIARSVASFYAGLQGQLDERLRPGFGASVMQMCETVAIAANTRAAQVSRAKVEKAPAHLPAAGVPDTLVIGGTGFIGKRLVRALIASGAKVRVLTRNEKAARVELDGLPVEVVSGSHGDASTLATALRGIDVIYHLAKASGEKWSDYLKNDVEPTRALAEAAIEHKVKRFIYTGTIDSYYSADERTVIDGDTPLDPQIASRNHYARSKAACEALLMELHRSRGLPLVILRPGIVIGAGAPPAHWGVGKFESDTRVKLWGSGTHPLPFVLVDDVAQALALARTQPDLEGRTLLLTDAPLLTARDYVQELEHRSGTRVDMQPTALWVHYALDLAKEAVKHAIGHPNRRAPSWRDWGSRAHRARYDSKQTQALLRWKPAGTREALLREGVEASVRWYYR